MLFAELTPFASSFSSIIVSEIGDKVHKNLIIDILHYSNFGNDLFNEFSFSRIIYSNGSHDSVVMLFWIFTSINIESNLYSCTSMCYVFLFWAKIVERSMGTRKQ